MTDIMKLADDYAQHKYVNGAEGRGPDAPEARTGYARAALQSALEALQKEVSTLDVLLEECKMDWSGDVTQLKAEHKHEIEALQSECGSVTSANMRLQAENERLKAERDQAADNVIVHIIECNRFEAERDALQSKLDELGKGEPVADQALQVAMLHFGHAKGHYMGMCSRCNERMDMVDKRCRVCVDCADKAITAHGIGGTP